MEVEEVYRQLQIVNENKKLSLTQTMQSIYFKMLLLSLQVIIVVFCRNCIVTLAFHHWQSQLRLIAKLVSSLTAEVTKLGQKRVAKM